MPRFPDDQEEYEDPLFPGEDPDDDDEDDNEDDDIQDFLPFNQEDMDTFYDWEEDFPELSDMDYISDLDDGDFYEG